MSRFNVHDEVIFKGERAFVVNVLGGDHIGKMYTLSTQRGEIRNVPEFLLAAVEQLRPPTDPDVGAMLVEINHNLLALNRRLERLLHLAEAMSKQRKK